MDLTNAKVCPVCGKKKDLRITPKDIYYELLGKYGAACISIECRKCQLVLYDHDDDVRIYEDKVAQLVKKWNGMKRPQKIWVAYDRSPARLPIAVSDSAAELGRMVGADPENIRSTAFRLGSGEYAQALFACVVVEDDDDAE